jgi:predicted double-glycine peptidase
VRITIKTLLVSYYRKYFTDNWLTDTSVIDSGEVVMATTIYTCGPAAALTTILKNLGIYTTEAELAQLAETDETGTSLWGLKEAAESKGVSAVGVRLSSDEIQVNYLVVLDIEGTSHFEVVKSINSTMVVLFDPNLGLIEMTREKFDELYIGVAMIFGEAAPMNATLLTDNEMRNIKGSWHTERQMKLKWVPGYWTSYIKVIDRYIFRIMFRCFLIVFFGGSGLLGAHIM